MAFNYLSRNLTLDRIPRGAWRIAELVSYDNGVVSVTVPKGFVTDLASIPKALRWFVSNDDYRVIRPAIIHDWLYLKHRVDGGSISRAQADLLFYEMLRVEGMGVIKAKLMYAAVRIGGWAAWSNE